MDDQFFEAWKGKSSENNVRNTQKTPCDYLFTLLSRASRLEALRIQVAELHGERSAWRRFTLRRECCISMDKSMRPIIFSTKKFIANNLLRVELDGFQDIECLLCLAPNLVVLRLAASTGFSLDANKNLAKALKHVPHLQELTYSPESMGVDGSFGANPDVELLAAIAQHLPILETLDLQTRWFGYDINFAASLHPVDPQASSFTV